MKKTLKEFKKMLALKLFGREPKLGECVCCGKEVDIFAFEDEKEFDEYVISHFCSECQKKTFGEQNVS